MSTRQRKTPRARAEEALAVADRNVDRLNAQRTKHADALAATDVELDKARIRLAYLKKNPDLAPPTTTGQETKA
jgi:hypothetical protein